MNLANLVTLSRVPMLLITVFLLYFDFPGSASIGVIIYTISGISDWLDGHLARKYNIVSTLGKFIDALIDKLFIIGTMVSLLALQIMPKWTLFLVILIIARELIITGLRLVAASQNVIIAAEKQGKMKTILQIVSVGIFILWFALTRDFGRWLLPEWISWIFYLGIVTFSYATYLTVTSGIFYMHRYSYLLKE